MGFRFITVAIAALVSGCVTTPRDLEGEQGSHFSEVVPQAPATAFRHLTQAARECYAHKAYRLDADFFPDVQEGRVTLSLTRASITMMTARLTPAANASTLLSVFVYDPFKRNSAKDEWMRSVLPWANGKPGYCVLDEFKPKPTTG